MDGWMHLWENLSPSGDQGSPAEGTLRTTWPWVALFTAAAASVLPSVPGGRGLLLEVWNGSGAGPVQLAVCLHK